MDWSKIPGQGEFRSPTASGQEWKGISEENRAGRKVASFRSELETKVIWQFSGNSRSGSVRD